MYNAKVFDIYSCLMSKKWLQNIEKGIVYLLLFLLPSQLALHFWPSWAFVFGIRVDYLAPAIYLTDVLALILIFANIRVYRKYSKYLLAIFVFAVINTVFSTSPLVSAFKWLKIIETVCLGLYFANTKEEFQKIIRVLFYSAVFFSFIGIFQFALGRSVGGLLYFLGERSFSSQTPGIALINIFDRVFLRAYSTFPHPNSLAGYLGVMLILFLDLRKKNPLNTFGIFVVLTGFLLSFSLTAFLALFLVLVTKYLARNKDLFRKLTFALFYSSIIVSILLPVFSKKLLSLNAGFGQRVIQRLDFAYLSGNMISERFWSGEGLNSFIVNIPRFKGILTYSWILQPVHNVPLLIISEIGIFGLLILFIVFYKSINTVLNKERVSLILALIFVVITSTQDHYWFTLQQNLLLASILFGLSYKPSHQK